MGKGHIVDDEKGALDELLVDISSPELLLLGDSSKLFPFSKVIVLKSVKGPVSEVKVFVFE